MKMQLVGLSLISEQEKKPNSESKKVLFLVNNSVDTVHGSLMTYALVLLFRS